MSVLTSDAEGWVAGGLAACCFGCTNMLRLRALALMPNLAFIVPARPVVQASVLFLHLMLAAAERLAPAAAVANCAPVQAADASCTASAACVTRVSCSGWARA